MKLHYPITVDLYNTNPLPVMKAQQNNVGRGALITLTANGEVLAITEEKVRIFTKRPDGFVSYLDCSILEDGKIQADFTDQMLSAKGSMKVELEFTTESTNITTPIFIVEVQESNVQSAVKSSNEFKALETYAKEALEAAKIAKEGQATVIVTNASGETIITTDSAEVTPVGITLFGKSAQNTVAGNQLLDPTNTNWRNSVVENKGVTFTPSVEDNFVKMIMVGTSTEAYAQKGSWIHDQKVKGGQTYVITAFKTGTNSGDIDIIVRQHDTSSATIKGSELLIKSSQTKNSMSITMESNTDYLTIILAIPSANVTVNAEVCLMLSYTEVDELEPYVGGEASPNLNYQQDVVPHGASGSIEQTLFGRNLCPKFEGKITHCGVTFDYKDGYVTITGTKPASDIEANSGSLPFKLQLPKGKYSMSTGNEAGLNVRITKADGSKQWKTNSFELDGNEQDVMLYSSIRRENTEVTVNETIPLQINMGEELLPYEKYKGEQVLVHQTPNGLHGQGDVADVIDYGQGKRITRFIKIPFLPTYDWRKYDTNFAVYNLNLNVNVDGATQMCNACHNFKKTGWKADVPQFAVADNYIRFVPNGFTDMTLEDFKARLEESEVYAICEMAEPIVTDLTEEELAQYNAVHMNYPNTTIVNSDSAYTEVEYVADTKKHIEQNYAPKSEIQEMKDQIAELQALAVNKS